ncbi:uncharacterized protein ColSpa_02097 [Colletotrichum spaethianum]|uniref:Uncharacterized protein n=1 Tax=Colletotrichum spaethianum TaxID=700344 RepID=A0AA37P4S2_9PEZI|nr:uncharacterized protein ColSpa_02097 [Colletotrichum spaethianum]GKT41916.1 hypothetical protein ColSpa_02097 [Colletotrichum spaethianum]
MNNGQFLKQRKTESDDANIHNTHNQGIRHRKRDNQESATNEQAITAKKSTSSSDTDAESTEAKKSKKSKKSKKKNKKNKKGKESEKKRKRREKKAKKDRRDADADSEDECKTKRIKKENDELGKLSGPLDDAESLYMPGIDDHRSELRERVSWTSSELSPGRSERTLQAS